MRLSGADIKHATGGAWHGTVPAVINNITTDTRGFVSGDLFLALRGPNFDGHTFASSVEDRALAMIGDHEGVRLWDDLQVSKLEVNDTLQALGDIAHAWRMRLQNTTVIAISGSYGKTSLRSILEAGFSALGQNVAATRANLNNLIGVPQTLLAVPEDADIAIIECGISEAGEMARLSLIVEPDIAVLTGLTDAHGEGLGGLAGVVREKAVLLDHLHGDGWRAVGDGVAGKMERFGIALAEQSLIQDDEQSGAVAWQLTGHELLLSSGVERASLALALPAEHWAANLAFAASIMRRYFKCRGRELALHEVAAALRSWQPPAGRMQQCKGVGGSLILDDSYNANPASMQAALDTLRAIGGSKIAILGDMAELGDASESAHRDLDVAGVDAVYLVGPRMKALAERVPDVRWFADTETAIAALSDMELNKNDTVLVKASRSMHLERIVKLLCRGEVAHAL